LILNTGQMLSIPLVLAGIYLIYNATQKSKDAV
jgi:prolipoprotein diacylglyceryltransferase